MKVCLADKHNKLPTMGSGSLFLSHAIFGFLLDFKLNKLTGHDLAPFLL